MGLNEAWIDSMLAAFFYSDFGWLGNLIPLAIVFGIAWGLSTKDVDFTLILFPLMLCAKIIFPFLHVSFVIIAFALMVMNIIGSKNDVLSEVKAIPQKIRDKGMIRHDMVKQAKSAINKEIISDAYSKVKGSLSGLYKK